jgi:hypothetical protein
MKLSRISLFAISMSVFSSSQIAFSQESVEAKAGPSSSAYSTALIERPFTLPGGTAEISGKMKFGNFSRTGDVVAPDMVSVDRIAMSVGITDRVQFGASWSGFQIPNVKNTIHRSANANLGVFLGATNWFASMASVDAPLNFNNVKSARDVFSSVSFSMPTAFGIGVKNLSFLAFYDGLVDFRFADKKYEASFNLPIKVGYQATRSLWVDLSTNIAKFEIGSDKAHSYIWKKAPLNFKALYAITNVFDVVADIGVDDVTKPKESFAFTLGVNYRVGNFGA